MLSGSLKLFCPLWSVEPPTLATTTGRLPHRDKMTACYILQKFFR